ncbi:MAG: peptidoglycan DD-metalloendopeptidase family protein [Undibacterium sp.]|nr:peptidoglycan DD-metalloendopeptidase family protein [Undibacterium sp.]
MTRTVILSFIISAASISSAAETPRAKEKKQAEAARSELLQKLNALKKDISKTESAKEKASDALEDSEEAISETNRSLRELQTEQQQAQNRLQQLLLEQQRLDQKVTLQKKQLSDLLRRLYMHGDSDRVKLLLSGDNPNRINRDLHYLSYISQSEAKLISALRASLEEVEKNAQAAQVAKDELDEIAQEEKTHKQTLEKEKKQRAVVLKNIAGKLHAQKKEAETLQKDEQRLNSLVSRLNKLMEEQAKAEQAKIALAEKQRKERLAAELAQKQAQAKKSGKVETSPEPVEEKTTSALPSTLEGAAFARQKGQLHLPVKGELIAKFGSKRGDAPSWKGLFIKAEEGNEVKAIAAGKVVTAAWMRGYGNILILDHGGYYLSLYSNNQAVLKHVGDTVKAGEAIAYVGNSGGNEETGLYFEMRYKGQVFDPLTWISR